MEKLLSFVRQCINGEKYDNELGDKVSCRGLNTLGPHTNLFSEAHYLFE